MELNSLLFAIIFFLATIGSIESQWNSRSDRNSTWQGQRGNYTSVSPVRPLQGNSSTTLSDRRGYRTTLQPPVWAGANQNYNGSHQSHTPNYQYNSSMVYPGLHESKQRESNGGGRPWSDTYRPNDTGRTNSTRLYPSLDFFKRLANPIP